MDRSSPTCSASARHSASRGCTRALRVLPLVLSLGAIAWVVWGFMVHLDELPAGLGPGMVRGICVGAAAYVVLMLLLGVAWWWLLGAYDSRPALGTACAIWARAQIAKYLPGNVLHIASRHVSGRAAGISHQGLVASLVFETGSLVIAGMLIAAAAAAVVAPAREGGRWVWLVAATVGALPLLWPWIDRKLRRFPPTSRSMRSVPVLSAGRTLRLLTPALALHLLFLAGSGLVLFGLLRSARAPGAGIVPVVGSYAVAWLAGTLVPGAPGGLGVREAVLVLQLAPLVGSATATTVALALRAVTLSGDVVTALLGWMSRIWLDPGGGGDHDARAAATDPPALGCSASEGSSRISRS